MSKRVVGSELFNVTYTRPRRSRVVVATFPRQNYLCRDRPIYVKTLLTGDNFDGADCISRSRGNYSKLFGILVDATDLCSHKGRWKFDLRP